VDFAVPARFGLTYRDKDNSNKTPLCIHRAPLGTHERFIGFLIEHYAGNFPLWLAPDQVRVITLNDDEALINYAKPIVAELRANMVRVDADFSATPFKAKISNAEQLRVHTMLVIGGRDMEAGAVSVRLHHGGPQGAKPKGEVVADILASIKERRAYAQCQPRSCLTKPAQKCIYTSRCQKNWTWRRWKTACASTCGGWRGR